MIYEQHLAAAERSLWPLDTSIPWDRIDRETAAAEPEVLEALRGAALVEGYLPVFIPRLMRLLWDDVDATAVLSVELFEGLRHYTALERYLDRVGYAPAARLAEDLVEARGRAVELPYERADILEHLTHFMCSELCAARFFLSLARRTREPVLKRLLAAMARDEFRHAASAGALLHKRVEADPAGADRVLAAAESFRHYGSDVAEVPVAEPTDFETILAINRKVRQVCGIAPTDHLKEAMRHGTRREA